MALVTGGCGSRSNRQAKNIPRLKGNDSRTGDFLTICPARLTKALLVNDSGPAN